MNDGTCQARYERLSENREVYLKRARECAKLTIPTLIREDGAGKHTNYPTPYQSVGARGVNNLASKNLLSLFPPNTPFFAMKVDDFTATEIGQQQGGRAKVDEALGKYERSVMQAVEDSGDRAVHFEAFKHLIVAGNVLLYLPKEKGTRLFALDQYVVVRDPMGGVIEVIIKEVMYYASLPDELKAVIEGDNPSTESKQPKAEVDVYTKFHRVGNKMVSYQEVEGTVVPGSEGSWPIDKSPILALRWTRIDGEDYGRSYVEEYLGDLIALDGLSRAILEGSSVSARLVFLVRPNGVTRVRDLAQAENGGFVSGNVEDVNALRVEKGADFSVALQQINTITERLSYAFLMNSAIQRAGERVTAEEVRFMAGELEDALGGVYSILSQEYQLPYVIRVIDRLTKAGKLPALPKDVAKPTIVTGLEALGRGHDLNKYDMFLKALMPLGPKVLQSEMNVGDYITRIGTALGIDLNGLVKSPEQKAAEAEQAAAALQQQQLADVAGKAVPGVAKEAASVMINQG